MYTKKYNKDEIINDNNLIFDLKNDIVFKNCFLDLRCKPYLVLLISKIFKLDKNIKENLIIKNSELPSRKVNEKNRYTDLICNILNYDFILEMNNRNSNDIYYKNIDYLFRQHIGRINKKNNYGKYIYTYLINIDNYDYFHKKDFIYELSINSLKYKIKAYKNIKIINVNLALLKYKYYNNIKLTDIEKILIIFIEQRIDKIKEIIKYKEVEGIIKVMKQLKYEDDFIATYDREEWEEYLREQEEIKRQEDERKRKEDIKKRQLLKKAEKQLENQKREFDISKNNIIKSLLKEGFTIEKISKMSKIPIEKIKTMII